MILSRWFYQSSKSSVNCCFRFRYSIFLSIFSGIIYGISLVIPLLNVLVFFSFIPLFFAILHRRKIGFVSFIFFFTSFLISFFWSYKMEVIGVGAPILLALIAAFFSSFSLIIFQSYRYRFLADITKKHWFDEGFLVLDKIKIIFLSFVFAGVFVFFELLRFYLFTGFPWNITGITQRFFPTIYFSSVVGVLGVSFLTVFLAVLFAFIFEQAFLNKSLKNISKKIISFFVFFFILCLFSYFFFKPKLLEPTGKKLNIVFIQGHVVPSLDSNVKREQRFPIYWKLTKNALAKAKEKGLKIDLIVWPETVIFIEKEENEKKLLKLLDEFKTAIILGVLQEIEDEEGHRYNTAFFYNKGKLQKYVKNHLVPIGEYTPFKAFMSDDIYFKVNRLIGMGPSLTTGNIPGIFEYEGLRIGVNICFEDLFPYLSYRYSRLGVNCLINITNDAWFKDSDSMRQHTNNGSLRIFENNLPMIRSGIHGDSMILNQYGEKLPVLLENMEHFYTDKSFGRGYKIIPYNVKKVGEATFFSRYPYLISMFLVFIFVYIVYFIIEDIWINKKALKQEE